MEHSKWHKKLNTIAFTFIALMPMFICIFELFRNGYNNFDISAVFELFSNPITSMLSNICTNTFNLTGLPLAVVSFGFGWFLFVELFEIIIMAIYYIIDLIKSFLNQERRLF